MRNVFPGVRQPSMDFQAVRDQRRSRPLYFVVNLATARSIANGITEDASDVSGKALLVKAAGNSWWSDPIYDSSGNYIAGIAVAHFEDTALGAGISTPITILPNSAQAVPFTQVILENFAQAGKQLRIIFGVDLDFIPGFNAQVTIGGTVSIQTVGTAYATAFQSNAALTASTPENVWAAASNTGGARIVAAGMISGNGTGLSAVSFLGKATAPATVLDGHIWMMNDAATGNIAMAKREAPIITPVGLRGDFIVQTTETTPSLRHAKYTLL